MTTRRSILLFVLALALCAPATASGKAKMTFTAAALNGTYSGRVNATLSFPVPAKSTASKACKGKITFSVPIGRKIVKKKPKTIFSVKTASLKTVAGACSASGSLKVPKAFLGTTLKFTATFKGNDVVKKFKKSARFLVALPPAPAPQFVPTSGPWTISQVPGGIGTQQWSFTMGAGGAVASIQRLTDLTVHCTDGDVTLKAFSAGEAKFDSPFQIAATDVVATDHYLATATGGGQADALSTFTLHFDAAGHATGTFQLKGTLVGEQSALVSTVVYGGCDTGPINIQLAPESFS